MRYPGDIIKIDIMGATMAVAYPWASSDGLGFMPLIALMVNDAIIYWNAAKTPTKNGT